MGDKAQSRHSTTKTNWDKHFSKDRMNEAIKDLPNKL
jgi:hypothetical protein